MRQIFDENLTFGGLPVFLAHTKFEPDHFTKAFGIKFKEGYESGLGPTDEACLETDTGQFFALIRYRDDPYTKYTGILMSVDSGRKGEDRFEELDSVLCDLELRVADLHHINLVHYRFRPSSVFREDDHGTEVLVQKFDSYPDACHKKRELEAVGHKQHYRIQVDRIAEKGWTGNWKPTPKDQYKSS